MIGAFVVIGVLAAASGVSQPVICFAFAWMWYVGTIVLALAPRRQVT